MKVNIMMEGFDFCADSTTLEGCINRLKGAWNWIESIEHAREEADNIIPIDLGDESV
ncbi:MAG TPA: hypothetical protein VIY48_09900 [Candidatus Paceibacterota bacterium]